VVSIRTGDICHLSHGVDKVKATVLIRIQVVVERMGLERRGIHPHQASQGRVGWVITVQDQFRWGALVGPCAPP
jgi:hypothetical protein